ncbi:hypothetical protein L6164_022740 [Bauhinia variegata]|uniref:Uncharacterized protein n=1 Tax=Bauhinia variegata TaxID=167791 RepID=A0ACB9MGP4_BAUVA|nr:hypothetical protein L6164_022740 [Bauhinia variegata]
MRLPGSPGVLQDIVKGALEQAGLVVNFFCCLHVTSNYLLSTVHVQGISMLPTLNMEGNLLLVEHVSPRMGKLRIGDMVSVQSPLNPRRVLIKRILGMGGNTVTYTDPARGDATHTAVVPKGHVWIQGDNIYGSTDSRQFGPLPYGLLQGKVLCRAWPIGDFGSRGH